jgi:hypothetical protein
MIPAESILPHLNETDPDRLWALGWSDESLPVRAQVIEILRSRLGDQLALIWQQVQRLPASEGKYCGRNLSGEYGSIFFLKFQLTNKFSVFSRASRAFGNLSFFSSSTAMRPPSVISCCAIWKRLHAAWFAKNTLPSGAVSRIASILLSTTER